jgi:hypothetical protein
MKTGVLVVAGVLASGAAAVGFRAAQAARAADEACRALAERQVALRQEIERAEGRRTAAETARAKGEIAMRAADVGPPAIPEPRPAVQTLDAQRAAAMDLIARTPWGDVVLEKYPELQARYLRIRRVELAATYGPFWATEKLTDAQVERFNLLMVEATERSLDLKSTQRTQGLAETDSAIVALRQQAEEKMRTAQREALGDAGFARLQEYERLLPVRQFVDALAGGLAFTEAPLSATQGGQLVQLLADASEAYSQGGNAPSLHPGAYVVPALLQRQQAREPIAVARVLAQAKAILSPPQFVRFEAEMLRIRAMVQVTNLMQRSTSDPVVGFTWGRPP